MSGVATHFRKGRAAAACGVVIQHRVTIDPTLVSCSRCKSWMTSWMTHNPETRGNFDAVQEHSQHAAMASRKASGRNVLESERGTVQVKLRLPPDVADDLDELAERWGLTRSGAVGAMLEMRSESARNCGGSCITCAGPCAGAVPRPTDAQPAATEKP